MQLIGIGRSVKQNIPAIISGEMVRYNIKLYKPISTTTTTASPHQDRGSKPQHLTYAKHENKDRDIWTSTRLITMCETVGKRYRITDFLNRYIRKIENSFDMCSE